MLSVRSSGKFSKVRDGYYIINNCQMTVVRVAELVERPGWRSGWLEEQPDCSIQPTDLQRDNLELVVPLISSVIGKIATDGESTFEVIVENVDNLID